MNYTKEQASAVKAHLSSLSDDGKSSFKTKFTSLSDEGKATVIGRLQEKYASSKEVASQGSAPSSTANLGFGNISAKMQQELPNRPNPFISAAESMKEAYSKPLNLSNLGERGLAGLQVLGAPYQAAESYVANRALRAQQQGSMLKGIGTFIDPRTSAQDLYTAATGPQKTFGDLNYRAGLDRGSADAIGFGESMMLQAPEVVAGGVNLVRKGIKPTIDVIKQIPSVATKSGRVATVTKYEKQLADKRWGTLTKWFGRKLDNFVDKNPTKLIDLRDDLVQASIKAADDPQLASALKHPKIQSLMDDLSTSKNLTLREVQEIKTILKKKLPAKVKSGTDYTPETVGVRNLIQSINKRIVNLDKSMQKVYNIYATKAEQYKLFSPSFRGKAAVENVLQGPNLFQRWMGRKTYLGGEKAQEAFAKFSPRIAREVSRAKSAEDILTNAKRLGQLAIVDAIRRKMGIKLPYLET